MQQWFDGLVYIASARNAYLQHSLPLQASRHLLFGVHLDMDEYYR